MIFSNYTIYDGKVYQVYFDKYNLKNRFFDKDGVVTGEVALALNKTYNAPKNNYLKGSGKLLIGILSVGLVITALTNIEFEGNSFDNTPKYMLNNTYEGGSNTEEVEEPINIENFYDELINRSGDNSEYISYMRKPIKDNLDFLQHDELLSTIDDLQIIEADESSFANPDIIGKYEILDNKITVRDNLSDSEKYDTIVHELFHYLSRSGISEANDMNDGYLGDGLNEGITQELVNEYFSRNDDIYPIGVAYTKALAEIVGKDLILDAYFHGDLNILETGLSGYADEDSVYILLNNIDQATANYDDYINTHSIDDYESLMNNNEMAWEVLGDMYKLCYGKDIEDDKLMYLYKSATMLRDEKSNVDFVYMGISKNYFNPDKLDQENYDVYYYTNYGEVIYDEFDESNRLKGKVKKRN